jgi:ADP-dependent NAD(P)H-hydrate dehydratase / NAD(P)H-hydrate epimerase
MRALDAHAIETIGIPGIVLMENAARSVVEVIEERFEDVEFLSVAVICGPGNNGGDGFAVARQLHLRGADVDVFLLCDDKTIKGDALTNYLLLEPLGITTVYWDDANEGISLTDYDLIVDALFGTGAVRPLKCPYKKVIEALNDAPGIVLAIDVPSGVDATTGATTGPAVSADLTVTFQCAKIGLLLPPGRDLAGDVVVAPISIPEVEDILANSPYSLPDDTDVLTLLPSRPRGAHKGDFGNLLVIAGSRGMSGAARLVSMAALRTGVGLVKCAAPQSIRGEIAAYRPEIMTIGLPETPSGTIAASAIETLMMYLEWADVIALGPGLGQEAETARFLEVLFTQKKPFVIDADALNLIAAHKLVKKIPPDAILTPHPGEFDRLAGMKHEDFTSRLAAAKQFALENQVTLLLKGAPTVTFDAHGHGVINPTGNPGLATAGSGDVLIGIIASLRAQGLESPNAAWIGAYLHGRSADLAVKETGEASLVAGDVILYLASAFASFNEPEESEENHEHHGCECGGHCK